MLNLSQLAHLRVVYGQITVQMCTNQTIAYISTWFGQMIDIAIRGAFINCGQNCIAAERFYIQEGIYDKFVDEITIRSRKFRQGPSGGVSMGTKDFGSMTMPQQVEIVDAFVQDAIRKGARLIHGGRKVENCPKESLCYSVTVLADVDHSMDIANKEVPRTPLFHPIFHFTFYPWPDIMVRVNLIAYFL